MHRGGAAGCPVCQDRAGQGARVPIMAAPMNLADHADVLIVDDHPLYRDGLREMLARRAPNFVCRVANDAAETLAALRRSAGCDLLLVDQQLPGETDGLALLARVAALYPTAARLISGSDGRFDRTRTVP